ncbi:MAG TPA: DUF2157 domain-containing protein [Thermoanaerobaculia bacterium]|nr:DUF2157 domain-containing protein [Thermoanaerobaculia bacterium]
MTDPLLSKPEAQRRADRIAAFRAELAALEAGGVLVLPQEQRAAVERHHDTALRDLAERFDVDVEEGEKRLSVGMWVASFLGATALALSVFLFFQRFWGLLTTPSQVAILVAAPAVAFGLTELAARRERTGTFASLLGLVAFACFVLDLTMLGRIFNIVPSANAFLAWALFGMVIAYAYGLRLPLAAGVICLLIWLAAQVGTLSGLPWESSLEYPEHHILAGLAVLAVPVVFKHRRRLELERVYRLAGLFAVLAALLWVAESPRDSRLPLDLENLKVLYHVLGFLVPAAAIAAGLWRRWGDMVYMAATFFVIHLYARFFDWWFDWMPKYLFFLILGLTAVGALAVLMRLRRALATRRRPS